MKIAWEVETFKSALEVRKDPTKQKIQGQFDDGRKISDFL